MWEGFIGAPCHDVITGEMLATVARLDRRILLKPDPEFVHNGRHGDGARHRRAVAHAIAMPTHEAPIEGGNAGEPASEPASRLFRTLQPRSPPRRDIQVRDHSGIFARGSCAKVLQRYG